MESLTILASALLPAALLLWYVLKKDTKPEPASKLHKAGGFSGPKTMTFAVLNIQNIKHRGNG